MIIRFDLKKFVLSLLPPLLAGGLSALITRGDMDLYKNINRPPLSPPGIVFPIVWTVLYILMGVSFYMILVKRDIYANKKTAFVWYFASLFLNFIWSPVFFSARQYLLAFVILVFLYVTVAVTAFLFYKIDKPAGLLQIPYIIWLTFAAYLNLGVFILN